MIKYFLEEQILKIKYLPSINMAADLLTKPLTESRILHLLDILNIITSLKIQ